MNRTGFLKWSEFESSNNLLYFAQVVEELISNYTIDSFKLPVHNVYTLILEYLKTIEHINEGILKEGALSAINEELKDIISKDSVFIDIFSDKTEMLINSLNNGDIANAQSIFLYVKDFLEKKYKFLVIKKLKERIVEGNYVEINRLSKSLLIMALTDGCSIGYIRKCHNELFKINKVDSIEIYDAFVRLVFPEDREYSIIFSASKGFKLIDNFDSSDIKVISSVEMKNISGFEGNSDASYVLVRVKSKDYLKAYSKSKYLIEKHTSLLVMVNHKVKYIVKNGVLISEDGQGFFKYGGRSNPIRQSPYQKIKISEIECSLKNYNSESRRKIELAYIKHLNAVKSVSYQSQLVDLWSGFEILIPINSLGKNKIESMCEVIVPVISSHYFRKIFNYLIGFIRHKSNREISVLLSSVSGSKVDALMKILMVKEYESVFNEIILTLDSNPILKQKLLYYKNEFSKTEDILRIFDNHKRRVEWQLRRIYRARNLIVHSGKMPYQLDSLIENLHHYYDLFLMEINLSAEKTEVSNSLEYFLLEYKFKDQKYRRFLQKNKKTIIELKNYNEFVGQ